MRGARFAIALVILVAVSVGGFATTFHGTQDSTRKVLIATEPTRYKNRMIRQLIDKLDDGQTLIVEVNHADGGLSGVDPQDYNAIFITNSGAQAMVRPWVMEWLASVAPNDENVVLHTTQITDWDPPVEVDSITSASNMRNIDSITDDIVQRLEEFF